MASRVADAVRYAGQDATSRGGDSMQLQEQLLLYVFGSGAGCRGFARPREIPPGRIVAPGLRRLRYSAPLTGAAFSSMGDDAHIRLLSGFRQKTNGNARFLQPASLRSDQGFTGLRPPQGLMRLSSGTMARRILRKRQLAALAVHHLALLVDDERVRQLALPHGRGLEGIEQLVLVRRSRGCSSSSTRVSSSRKSFTCRFSSGVFRGDGHHLELRGCGSAGCARPARRTP